MSTRATVWIRSDKDDESVFLFHHCDGYCLDEDIDPALKNLHDDAWNVVDIQDTIQALEFGDSYRRVDTVGWDSEYVYKISVDECKMYKYYTGIGDPHNDETNFESRLTDLERTYEYLPEKWEDEPKEELSPLAAKLKEIVNSYDEDHSMTNEGAEFYANQLRPLVEEKKEEEVKIEGKRFDEATLAQVLQIQLIELVKYACKWLDLGTIPNNEVDRIQKLFKTLNEK